MLFRSAGHVYTTTTDPNGVYTFTSTLANPIAAGDATVQANSVAGYGADSQTKTIVAGTTNTQNLTLPPTAGPATILTGVVTDRNTGLPIPGAVVTVTDSGGHIYTTTTDISGRYTFTGTLAKPLDAGNATVQANSVAGYGSDSQTKTIVAGTTNTQNLSLPPTILTGVITDSNTGAIIAGATVTVTDSAGHVYTTTTDPNGVYTFTSTVANPLAAGDATVAANSVAGYGSDSQVKTIVAGVTNTQNLTLPPTAGGTDFGDLPAPYKTLLADDGPRHSIVPGAPYLGAVAPDAEPDGQPNAAATGDDSNGADDEEGVTRTSGKGRTDGGWSNGTVASGQGGAVSLTISGAPACLGAFMDFNASGALSAVTLRDASGAAISQPIAAGTHTFYFDVPAGTFTGSGGNPTIYSLFRVTSPVVSRVTSLVGGGGDCTGSKAYSATGAAPDCEVESFGWGFTPTAVTLREFKATAPWFDLAAWIADLLRRLRR